MVIFKITLFLCVMFSHPYFSKSNLLKFEKEIPSTNSCSKYKNSKVTGIIASIPHEKDRAILELADCDKNMDSGYWLGLLKKTNG